MKKLPKTLLIYPPITTDLNDSAASATLPIGLCYLAGVLEKEGYPVRIIDAVAEGSVNTLEGRVRAGLLDRELTDMIQNFKPDIIGISCMFTAYARDSHNLARLAKEVSPDSLVIFGGAHASCNYDMVLKDPNVDFIVRGEGEDTLVDIVRATHKRIDLKKIKGLIYFDNGMFVFTEERPYISNLDTIPFPALHLVKIEKYIYGNSPYWMRKPLSVLVSSRGCPKRCIYCSIHSVWGDKWRSRSAKNVVDEMELLMKDYGIQEIHFNDDNISADKQRMHEICDEIISRKIDIRWTMPNGIALWTLDRPLIRKMKKAGCYRLTFGIESGDPQMQQYIGKRLDLNYAKKVIHWANAEGMWTICTHILGFPFETKQQIENTVKYACSSGTDFALFYNLTPFRGTQVFRIFESEKLIPENSYSSNDFFVAEFSCATKNFTKEEIQKIQSNAYRRFMKSKLLKLMFNPLHIARKLYSFESSSYAFRMLKNFISISINLNFFKSMSAKVLYGRKK